jgi:addiction module RelB/DinJ family antitoxin
MSNTINTTITIKTKKNLRDKARKTAMQLGVPLTTVMNAMLKQFVRDQEIVLSLHTPNSETQKAMRDIEARKNIESFKTIDAWKKSLHA